MGNGWGIGGEYRWGVLVGGVWVGYMLLCKEAS